MLLLDTPVTKLIMVGPQYGAKLKIFGIETIDDLLHHTPFRYENYSLISKIADLQAGEKVTVRGTLETIKNIYTKNAKKIQKAILKDDTGQIDIIWYNQPFLTKVLKSGQNISISGVADYFGTNLVFTSPDYEIIKQSLQPTTYNLQLTTNSLVHTGRLVPVYHETEGLSSKWIRSRIYSVLHKWNPNITEFIPSFILQKYLLMPEKEAIRKIHFPDNVNDITQAKRRLAFDELLILSIASLVRKREWEGKSKGHPFGIKKIKEKIDHFIANLPFALTHSQLQAIDEILSDLSKRKPMNRMLEGDVGSGKTVVAAIAMYASYLCGYKSAFMAPTEILATQHFKTIKSLLDQYKINIILITGSSNRHAELISASNQLKTEKIPKQVCLRRQVRDDTMKKIDVFIGTHALLSIKLKIKKLGLVVIDEQQRFGVTQRLVLRQKGNNPHLISLTATPIPRSIALTIFADLDLSIIDEMPKGRKIIKTWVVPSIKREAAYNWIRNQIKSQKPKGQAYIICPFIELSENMDTVRAAKEEYKKLKDNIFPDLNLGLLHGKLTSIQKNKTLSEFKKGKIDILVATPVVEVGIDIPNVTIMMIEGADRFGLSQLHQLRGRVGRCDLQSYCLLFTESSGIKTEKRLKMLETNFIGPKLAELDLKLRGPGDLYGIRQHGELNLKFADFSDHELFKSAKNAAESMLSQDPNLSGFTLLQKYVQKYTIKSSSQD